MSTPSIGRDVHYVARGSLDGVYPPVCRAAKLTAPNAQGIKSMWDVIVFNPRGVLHQINCMYDETNEPGTWHWPERVGD